MDLSWKVLLSPILGALLGKAAIWIQAHFGVALDDTWQQTTLALFMATATWAAHGIVEWERAREQLTFGRGVAPPPDVPTVQPSTKQSGRALLSILLMLSAVAFVASCATTLQTFNEKLYVAYGASDGIAKLGDTLLKDGKLSPSLAKNIATQDANLKAALDIASTTYQANQADGGNQLQTAMASLTALTTYLEGLQ